MYFEDFEIDFSCRSKSRIVTNTDIEMFAMHTGCLNPIFLSDKIAIENGRKQRFAPGTLVFSLAVGMCYQSGVFDRVISMAEIDCIKFLSVVYPGDEITAITTPLKMRSSKKNDRGVIMVRLIVKNQHDSVVLTGDITFVVQRRYTD